MNLKSLFAKLNETSRTATESAAALCLSEHHYEVEVEHLLLQLLDNNDSDLAPIDPAPLPGRRRTPASAAGHRPGHLQER